MAGGKETPRQRMIGIMYLVLLGLIALNVPDSLLDAFKNITDSLDKSKSNVTTSIDNTYTAFEATKLKEQPERAKPIYAKAKEASRISNELNTYVEALRAKLVKEGGGFNPNINDVNARDNLDISPRIMISQKNGEELKKKINETRQKLIDLLDPKDRATVNFSLNANDPPPRSGMHRDWEEAYFGDGIPLGATLTTLAKIQADTKNAESETVKKILGKVDQAVVNLDKFQAVAVAPSSYILQGQPYTAQVFLTASDSHSNPTITVDGSPIPTQGGTGNYSATSSEGTHTWVGIISVKDNNGKVQTYKTTPQTYQVARPSAVVSPDKMNVLFIGVANPVSISAPGIPKEKLHISVSNGSYTGKDGKYEITVNSPGDATVTVSGELQPGKTQTLGSTLFRIKRVPDPVAQFAGRSSGATSATNLKAQDRLFAKMIDFYFDLKFDVVRFNMIILRPRQDAVSMSATGSELTAAMKTALGTITPGSRVIFTNIMAKGPGGERGLADIILSAN